MTPKAATTPKELPKFLLRVALPRGEGHITISMTESLTNVGLLKKSIISKLERQGKQLPAEAVLNGFVRIVADPADLSDDTTITVMLEKAQKYMDAASRWVELELVDVDSINKPEAASAPVGAGKPPPPPPPPSASASASAASASAASAASASAASAASAAPSAVEAKDDEAKTAESEGAPLEHSILDRPGVKRGGKRKAGARPAFSAAVPVLISVGDE
jgi:hypothetical protein